MKLLEAIGQAFQHVKSPSPHELRALMQQLDMNTEEVSSYVEEPSCLPYGRTVLFRSDEVEVILIHLPAGRETYIHDHGASEGCALVLEGQLTNRHYRLGIGGYAYENGSSIVKANQFMYAPTGQIHQMCNEGKERVVSLHAYTPVMKDTKIYATYEQVLDYVI